MDIVHFIPPSQRRIAMLAAQADQAPVLICGATGTGKSHIASWIHKNSPRSGLVSMTADRTKALGEQIRECQGGTLLIPEIAEWPLSDQKTLLDFLVNKTIPHPTGNGTPMLVNVRIITTSSHNLDARVQGGLFNAELLKKLNVFRIEMPDLSKRAKEFEEIVQGIVSEITHELHKEHIRKIADEAFTKMRQYHWPGNLRELRNVLRVAVISASGDAITLDDLPEDFDQEKIDFQATREEFEKLYIVELLKTFDWQIDRTCQVSRINKETLLSKMKKYGIETMSNHPSMS